MSFTVFVYGLTRPVLAKSFASSILKWYVILKSLGLWLSISFGSVVSSPDLNKSVLDSRSNEINPSLSSSQIMISSTGNVIGNGLILILNDVSALKHPVSLFWTLTKIWVAFKA